MEIPHELMYALGLEHTFEEKEHPNKEHIFRKESTENYMDYDNTKKTTFKWQWDIVRISKWIKRLFLILLCLSAFSCNSYKNVSCEYDYMPKENEKVLDTLTFPLDKKIVNNKRFFIFKRLSSGYSKFIDIDTLGIVITKFITYDNRCKIIRIKYQFNNEFGKEYHFDEKGNVTKVIDNDEGFAICWQQALFIAKKYAGKKATSWRMGKASYKDRDCWEFYYFKGRDHFLYIDAQTGEIVRKGFVVTDTNDLIDTSLYEKDSLQ